MSSKNPLTVPLLKIFLINAFPLSKNVIDVTLLNYKDGPIVIIKNNHTVGFKPQQALERKTITHAFSPKEATTSPFTYCAF